MEKCGATVQWDDRIEQIMNIYGKLAVDFAHYLFEERFIVGFQHGGSCC